MKTQPHSPTVGEQLKSAWRRLLSSPADRPRDIINVSYGVALENPALIPHFALIIPKLTEGDSHVDPRLAEHWGWGPDKSDFMGGFHVCQSHGDPIQQANFFVDTALGLDPIPDCLFGDYEWVFPIQWALDFQGQLELRWRADTDKPFRPGFYTNANILVNHFRKDPLLMNYFLWFAWPVDSFVVKPLDPAYVDDDEWGMWQDLWQFDVPGLRGSCNRSQWNGAREEMWQALSGELPPDPVPGDCPNEKRVRDLEANITQLHKETSRHWENILDLQERVSKLEAGGLIRMVVSNERKNKVRTFYPLNDHELAMHLDQTKSFATGQVFTVTNPKEWKTDDDVGKQLFWQVVCEGDYPCPKPNLVDDWVRDRDIKQV